MFEIFTNRARRVVELGKSEAKRDGSYCVGTEHILMGLIKEDSGIGHHILENNGVTALMVRQAIFDKKATEPASKDPPFSPRAKSLFSNAIEEAKQLGHNYVGTEHILLALLAEKESLAVEILEGFHIIPGELRKEVLNLLGFVRKFSLIPMGENDSFSICLTGDDTCVGIYNKNTQEFLFNRLLTIDDLQSIIRTVLYE